MLVTGGTCQQLGDLNVARRGTATSCSATITGGTIDKTIATGGTHSIGPVTTPRPHAANSMCGRCDR